MPTSTARSTWPRDRAACRSRPTSRSSRSTLPEPADGEVLIRNAFVSVDPYMRGRMNDAKSYVPPFVLGEPMAGGAVGEVVASRNAGVAEGDWVVHDLGWRELALVGRPTACCSRPGARRPCRPRSACSGCPV